MTAIFCAHSATASRKPSILPQPEKIVWHSWAIRQTRCCSAGWRATLGCVVATDSLVGLWRFSRAATIQSVAGDGPGSPMHATFVHWGGGVPGSKKTIGVPEGPHTLTQNSTMPAEATTRPHLHDAPSAVRRDITVAQSVPEARTAR